MTEKVPHNLKVGDELAFECNSLSGWRWYIYKIDKITPSGRIKCGFYTLNPDLTIRGGRSFGGAHVGEIITEDIRQKIDRQKQMKRIKSTQWDTLSNTTIKIIAEAIEANISELQGK